MMLTLLICVPVKRSYARLPVSSASAWGPPMVSSSARHSRVVDESCQMGELWIENAFGLSCESNDLEGSSEARASAAEFDQ